MSHNSVWTDVFKQQKKKCEKLFFINSVGIVKGPKINSIKKKKKKKKKLVLYSPN